MADDEVRELNPYSPFTNPVMDFGPKVQTVDPTPVQPEPDPEPIVQPDTANAPAHPSEEAPTGAVDQPVIPIVDDDENHDPDEFA